MNMRFQVDDITPFDNENGKGTCAKVGIYLCDDSVLADLIVYVQIPLNWESSLLEVKQQLINEAKSILRKTADDL